LLTQFSFLKLNWLTNARYSKMANKNISVIGLKGIAHVHRQPGVKV